VRHPNTSKLHTGQPARPLESLRDPGAALLDRELIDKRAGAVPNPAGLPAWLALCR
jgi:hypothetical protein